MNTINFTQFVTFGDYAQFWLATKVDTKPTTRACYRSFLQCAAARFSDTPIDQIERPDIMRWIVDLIDQREYDAGQVRAAHRVVHSTLALARSLGAIDSNPATDIVLPRIRTQSPRLDRRLTLPELETLSQQIGWWKLVPVHEVPSENLGHSRGCTPPGFPGASGFAGSPVHEAPSGVGGSTGAGGGAGGGAGRVAGGAGGAGRLDGIAGDAEARRDMRLAPHEPRPTPGTTHRTPQFLQVKGKSGYLARREVRYGNRQWPRRKRRRRTVNTAPLPLVNQLEVLTIMLGYCGLRIGEALALTWGDIEWSHSVIHVRHTFTEVSGRLVLGTPKNGKTRTVPIPRFLVEGGLRRLFDFDCGVFVPIHEVPAGIGGETPRYTPSELRQVHIFRTLQGKPLRASNLRFHFALAAASIGETGLHIHDLRHTAASLAVSAGANVKALAQMLGHSSAAMTLDVYADLFAEDLSGVAEALDGLRRRQLG